MGHGRCLYSIQFTFNKEIIQLFVEYSNRGLTQAAACSVIPRFRWYSQVELSSFVFFVCSRIAFAEIYLKLFSYQPHVAPVTPQKQDAVLI